MQKKPEKNTRKCVISKLLDTKIYVPGKTDSTNVHI